MGWKTDYRSLYYQGAPEPEDPVLVKGKTALLVIDVQNVYLVREARETLPAEEQARFDAWTPFHERMHGTVNPTTARLIEKFRDGGHEEIFARFD